MIKYVRKAFSLRGYYSNNSNLGASIEENGTANITSMDALITTYEYWSSQDSSSNYYNDRIWLQHAIRASQYSYASMRHILKGAEGKSQGAKGGQLYMDCLSLLSDMCCHQYDEIRAKALKGFGMVSTPSLSPSLSPSLVRCGMMTIVAKSFRLTPALLIGSPHIPPPLTCMSLLIGAKPIWISSGHHCSSHDS